MAWKWFDEFRRNVAFGCRGLLKNPLFALTAVVTLGLCIGANTAVFSLVDSVLLRPLPYPEPDRLMLVATHYRSNQGESVALAQDGLSWELIRDHADFLDRAVFSAWATGVNLAVGEEPGYVRQQRVGAGFFSVLGVAPLAGREFTPEEDRPGGGAVTMLSSGLATRLFGDARRAVGREIQLRGEPYLVIGVMPRDFDSGTEADLWTPLRPNTTGEGQGTNYRVLVRLPSGLSESEARSRIAALGAQDPRRRQAAAGEVSRELDLVKLQEGRTESLRPTLSALSAFVVLVLILGCVNLAGLLLARHGRRRREIAVRMALGGGRGAVVRQLMTESLVLAAVGGAAGLGFGLLSRPLLEGMVRDGLGVSQRFALDLRTLAFCAAAALGCSILFGLVPALQAGRLNIHPILSEAGGRGVSTTGRTWTRRILVSAQVALVVVLLVASGLLLRTFFRLTSLPPGFDPAGAITAKVSLQDARYAQVDDVTHFFDATLDDLRRRPGVEAAGVGLTFPYERPLNLLFGRPDASEAGDQEGRLTNVVYVTPGYFEALEMTLLRGRLLTSEDDAGSPRVVVVNQAFVDTYLEKEDVLGTRLALSAETREIVGVIGDVQSRPGWGDYGPLGRVPVVYLPVAQTSDQFLQLVHTWFSPGFVVRSRQAFQPVAAELRRAVHLRDPQLPLFAVQPMEDVMAGSWAQQRVVATLVGALAGLALLLAAVGLYGLIANAVVERRRELGIRMALGASVSSAVAAVAMSGIRLTLAGVAVGCIAAYWAQELIQHLLWGVTTSDAAAWGGAILVLLFTAAAASLIPSLGIVRLDPAETLRR